MEREPRISAAEAGNKMVFKRANGTFSCITAMDSGGGELKVNVRLVKELL